MRVAFPMVVLGISVSIIDLSYKSSQPMVDAELGLALVFNGTIYNYPELRRTESQGLLILTVIPKLF